MFTQIRGWLCAIMLVGLYNLSNVVAQQRPNQPRTAKGVVVDENDVPLSGARVLLIGTSNSTATNEKGEFTIRLNRGNNLEISYMGMKTQVIQVTTNAPLHIRMEQEVTEMDEVVVIGYGEVQKRDLTGAIGSVKASDFEDQPIADVNQALQGQLAGVNVMNTSGTPGGGLDIQIRGISSLSSSTNPLYVVDGNAIQVGMNSESNPLSFINPSDIESIDILKDASAAAIYGSRASNGVVLITTKSGKSGKARLTYNLKAGSQHVFNRMDVLSGREFAELAMEARNNTWVDRGNSEFDADNLRPANLSIQAFRDFLDSGKEGTDWQDAIFREAWFQDHQLSVSGGNNTMKYLFSGNFLDQQGVVKRSGFKRYSARANVEATVNPRLRLGIRLSPTYTDQDFLRATGRYHDANGGIIQGALLMNPMLDIYDPESYTGYTMGINQPYGMANVENPVAKVDMLKDWRRNFALLGNAYADYKLSKLFTLRGTAATTIRSMRSDRIVPSTIGSYARRPPRENAIVSEQNIIYNFQTNVQLSYNQRFGKHRLSGVAVQELQMNQQNNMYARASDTWTDELITVDNNLNAYQREGYSAITEWALSSWIARMNYNYDDRYLLSASIRADGSSRFKQRWGTFPSAALAWRISNERFMQHIDWLSDLKLRTSFGVTGNNSIGNYTYISLLSGSSYVLGSGGETIIPGVRLGTPGSDELSWEQTRQVDVGTDMALFNNRISLTVDYYNKQTRDLLLNLQVPGAMGFTNVMTNIGKIENKGWEFNIDSRNLTGKFKWSSGLNFSLNRQKVLALGPEGDPLWGNSVFFENTHYTEIGKPMGQFYGLKVIGIYQNQQQVDELPSVHQGAIVSRPGEFIFEDVNKDGEITVDDRTVIGNVQPDFVFGLKNSFSYQKFTLNVLIRGSYGGDVMNMNYGDTHYLMNTNFDRSALNRWQSESEPGNGKTPRVARLDRATLGASTVNSSFIQDASFLNIQNVTLRYDFSPRLLQKMKVEKLGAQVSVQNLYMLTNYTGYNPEGGINMGSTLAPGVDWGRYPLSRTFTLGINCSF